MNIYSHVFFQGFFLIVLARMFTSMINLTFPCKTWWAFYFRLIFIWYIWLISLCLSKGLAHTKHSAKFGWVSEIMNKWVNKILCCIDLDSAFLIFSCQWVFSICSYVLLPIRICVKKKKEYVSVTEQFLLEKNVSLNIKKWLCDYDVLTNTNWKTV